MHTITKLLLTYYLNISVQAANLSNFRIESKLFFALIGMLYLLSYHIVSSKIVPNIMDIDQYLLTLCENIAGSGIF